jgi:hypothetical protein
MGANGMDAASGQPVGFLPGGIVASSGREIWALDCLGYSAGSAP